MLAFLILLGAMTCGADQKVVTDAGAFEALGKFQEAAKLLQAALAEESLDDRSRKEIAFEVDRLERICKDYPRPRCAGEVD